MIETYLLEQLVAVSEYGTLSAASEHLHLSQPALSRSMKKLEDLLGVELFDRGKNKISLNPNGVLATEMAQKILEQQLELVERVRAFDRSRRTITLGSCAPIPIWELLPLLNQAFPDMTIASVMKDDDALLHGLHEEIYQLVVLHREPKDDALYCHSLGNEQLYISLPPAHPLAGFQQLHMKDLDGQTILLYSQIGFWYDLCLKTMPNARFLLQNEYDVFGELATASALPCFTTNLGMKRGGVPVNRKIIPLVDEEANAKYFCACLKKQKGKLMPFMNLLIHDFLCE